MAPHRVVVTGIGIVSPIGTGIRKYWEALKAGVSGCSAVTRFDAAGNRSRIACEVDDFEPADFMDPKTAKRTSRFVQFAVAAARMCREDAGADVRGRADVGVYVGTGAGGFDALDEVYGRFHQRGPRSASPFAVTNIIPSMAASNTAIDLKIHGPCVAPVAACASGLYAVVDAYHAVRQGLIRSAFAGGTESTMTSFVFSGYEALRVLSRRNERPEAASRPFDAHRDGFVMGEGAAVLYLEDHEAAVARNAEIYGEVVACGTSCDAAHITSPDDTGGIIANTMQDTLEQAGVGLDQLAYINAHATSTVINDRVESKAIHRVSARGGRGDTPVTAIKSMIGHTLGASGAMALAASLISLRDGVIPPTINTGKIDPALDPIALVTEPRTSGAHQGCVLTNAFGFGGHNACVLVKKL